MKFLVVFLFVSTETGQNRSGDIDFTTVGNKRMTVTDLSDVRDSVKRQIGPGNVVIQNIIELGDGS